MATQAAIDDVKNQLPDEIITLGITDNMISAVIDSSSSHIKTMLAVWQMIAGKVTTVVDVSESGSSRQNSVIFDRAKQMIDFWQSRSEVEDQKNNVLPIRAHGASLRAVRV